MTRRKQTINRITLSWKDWRADIAALRVKGPPSMLEHAE
jgi:hypothetical protein